MGDNHQINKRVFEGPGFGPAHGETARFQFSDVALSQGAALFKSFFDGAAIGFSITDLNGRFLKVNPAYCAITGYTEAELYLLDFQSITHPEDLPQTIAKLANLISGEFSSCLIEERYVRKDEIVVWVLNSVSVIRDQSGRPTNLIELSQDITEQMQLEESLRQAELHTESILASITDTHVLFDRQWRYLYVNEACVRAMGRPRNEIIGRALWEVYPDIAGTELEREYRRAMNERAQVNLDFYYPSTDTWWQNRFYPVRAGLAVFATDISERRRAEEEVRKHREVLQTIFDHIPVMISSYDEDNNATLINREWERTRGWSLEEIQKHKVDLLAEAYPDPQELQRVKDFIAAGSGKWADFRTHVKDGRVLDTSWAVVRLPDGMRINIGQDITERKQAEEKLREYEKVVEGLEEMIVVVDRDYRYLLANSAFLKYRGLRSEQVVGHFVPELLGQKIFDNLVKPKLDECFQGKVVKYKLSYSYPDLGERDLLVSYFPIEGPKGVDRAACILKDVTEAKRAADALREKERFINQIAELTPVVIDVFDLTTLRHTYFSRDVVDLYGYTAEEFLQMKEPFANLAHPDDIQRMKENIGRLGPSVDDQITEFECRVQRRDGEWRWTMSRSMPFTRNDNGEVQQVVTATLDITERKRVEEALRASEERYRELFDNSKDALYVHDLSGRYLSFNRAAERLSGYSRDEILGKHFSNFVAPSHLGQVRENLCRKLDEVAETTYEIDLVTKDRRRVPVEVSSRLIYEDGKPVGVQGTVRDITELKRAEAARTQFAWLVGSSDDGIIAKTLDGIILSWNSGAEKIYGYSSAEVIGCSVDVLVPTDRRDELPLLLERLRRGESIHHYETVRRRKDGKLIDVSLTLSPIRDARNTIVGASTISRDVTEKKQAELALKTFSRRLIEAQEVERQHIARELHDEIGQVLTAVRINLQSLRSPSQAGPVSLALDDSLAIVDEALEAVRELSLNLRPPVLDNLGLASALRWYVDRYARRSGIVAELNNDLEDGHRLSVELETGCFRIVQEALTNVARHARATHVFVDLKRSNGNLELRIRDDGVGFDIGWLLKNSGSGSASALGLRGMKERAVALNGRLKIDSKPKSGTKISVSFPLQEGR
jgi:PAS domain S-box-containing protein